jgi:5'-nucleotidase (lipoprotein e(P4) family)
MNSHPLHLIILSTLLATGCCTSRQAGAAPGHSGQLCSSDGTLAVLWSKYAAEARALHYQAYNVAHDRLDLALAANTNRHDHLAVILDIDESVLDNTPFEASIFMGNGFSMQAWTNWTAQAAAAALPGAGEFLSYAVSRGVEVFYVSNRGTSELGATIQNLRLRKFPMADADHVLLQAGHEGKVPNRNYVRSKCTVVLLIGDELNDVSEVFDNKSARERFCLTDQQRVEFGRKFILLPNPMYGRWEDSLYGNKRLSAKEKASIRRKLMTQP